MATEGERFRLHATSILLLIKDDKILLCRRHNTGWEDGKYGFMAGHLDGDESFTKALCREAKEELGIVIKPEDLRFVHVQHHISNKEYVYMYFAASKWRGEPSVQEPDKCDDVRWFPLDDLPKELVADTRYIVDCYVQGVAYSESGYRV
jgi:8-oxo-dGTP diphosphatase